jgi:hypothetical protein
MSPASTVDTAASCLPAVCHHEVVQSAGATERLPAVSRKRSSPTIFVSIAAYRDPLLVPTVVDCIAKATRPDALRFGICWQRDESEPELPFLEDERFRVLTYDWRDAQGISWARGECMSVFEGEDFYLQLDSHHRFVEGWDDKLVRYMEVSGSQKPLLTAQAAHWDPNEPDDWTRIPTRLAFARWSGHIPLFRLDWIPGTERLGRLTRARSISGHFCFSTGDFVRDIPCDPAVYFYGGNEITVAVRAFTSGYDLFHPPEAILSHAYASARGDRRTHWDDYGSASWSRSRDSYRQIGEFLTNPHTGLYGCGTVRTIADYEAYAGLSFRHCRAQTYTHVNKEPPNPPAAADWADQPQEWHVSLTLQRRSLPAALSRSHAWHVSFEDALGHTVHIESIEGHDLAQLLRDRGRELSFSLKFQSEHEPAAWLLQAEDGEEPVAVRGFVGRPSAHGEALIQP